jgi:hypothetical protein
MQVTFAQLHAVRGDKAGRSEQRLFLLVIPAKAGMTAITGRASGRTLASHAANECTTNRRGFGYTDQ